MTTTLSREIASLPRMNVRQLLQRYAEVFGETTATKNKAWLVKRIAWRIQSNAEGGLSERALQRAAELANNADLRRTAPKVREATVDTTTTVHDLPSVKHDRRLPPPGTILKRPYKGGVVQVRILADGFEHEGTVYASLSAVAKAVTGSHCNGFLFFRLGGAA